MNHFRRYFPSYLTMGLIVTIGLQWLVIFKISRANHTISKASSKLEHPRDDSAFESLRREAITRVGLYEQLIQKQMLVDGMIVSRTSGHQMLDHCDSLLFSALRLRSLVALDMKAEAQVAWDALSKSRVDGQWMRHPKCRQKPLSRDMFMGVLVALESAPPSAKAILTDTLKQIDYQNGFIGSGPFYVSFLSPGPAGLLRAEAEYYQIPFEQWPWILKQSFSSIEYDALFLKPGFESHLAGLSLWLEVRLQKRNGKFNARSLLGEVEKRFLSLRAISHPTIEEQRRFWIANQLAQENPKNLFFQFMRSEFDGSMSRSMRQKMLKDLLTMKAFPIDRLPTSCDRKADYLWQRSDLEHVSRSTDCMMTFAGVDFIWMVSLLIGDPELSLIEKQ